MFMRTSSRATFVGFLIACKNLSHTFLIRWEKKGEEGGDEDNREKMLSEIYELLANKKEAIGES